MRQGCQTRHHLGHLSHKDLTLTSSYTGNGMGSEFVRLLPNLKTKPTTPRQKTQQPICLSNILQSIVSIVVNHVIASDTSVIRGDAEEGLAGCAVGAVAHCLVWFVFSYILGAVPKPAAYGSTSERLLDRRKKRKEMKSCPGRSPMGPRSCRGYLQTTLSAPKKDKTASVYLSSDNKSLIVVLLGLAWRLSPGNQTLSPRPWRLVGEPA